MSLRCVLRPLLPLVALLLLHVPSGLAMTYTYTTLDVPGSLHTHASDINNAGQIVGTFTDARGCCSHGFLFSGGQWTILDAPGSTSTTAYGINDAGQVVGGFSDARGTHGFLFSGGQWTILDAPGSIDTIAYGINEAGRIVGAWFDIAVGPIPFRNSHGFLFSGGDYATIDWDPAYNTSCSGVNALGDVLCVATVKEPACKVGCGITLLVQDGLITTLTLAGVGAQALNNTGTLLGGRCNNYPFPCEAVLIREEQVFPLAPSNLPGTVGYAGLNDAEQLVGAYQDGNASHGFLATPAAVPEPGTGLLLGAGVAGLLVAGCARRAWGKSTA